MVKKLSKKHKDIAIALAVIKQMKSKLICCRANHKLSQVVAGEKFKFLYTYDFGDDWEHEILVEKVLPVVPDTRYPICLTGKRACPLEDCGGPWGYTPRA